MSTKGVLDRCLPWCPGWELQSGRKNLLKLAEKALDELYAFDHDCMIYRGTDNKGYPPYLLTTAGTYRYEIKSANLSCGAITKTINGTAYNLICRKVNKVFVDVTNTRYDYNKTWVGTPYHYALNPYTTKESRIYVCEVKGNSQPGYENTNAYFEFLEDPGTETERYFVEFFIGPPRLLSTSIPMPIPYRYEDAIETFILGKVQALESGRTNDNLQTFYSFWKPEFEQDLQSGANIAVDETPIRYC